MGSCILIGAGDFGGLLEPIQRDDYVIAVDGGLNHAKRLGIIPNTILGDFDSLGFVPDGSTAFPIEKDGNAMSGSLFMAAWTGGGLTTPLPISRHWASWCPMERTDF